MANAMDRVYNFSAGPSMLPIEVLERAQAEMLSYGDSGMSVMEMSHRTPEFEEILQELLGFIAVSCKVGRK